jgi:tryptophan synthase alpha chain
MSDGPGPSQAIADAIHAANAAGRPALVAFLTAGFPSREQFEGDLLAVAEEADVVEIGVPFTDPMADGMTIQRSSEAALAAGVTLDWILSTVAGRDWPAPLLLMSYLNPLLSLGEQGLARRASESGVAGFICPDLPFEESAPMREAFAAYDLALVQLVTPVTPEDRLRKLCAASRGFVYAVTVAGVTGGSRAGAPGGDAAPDLTEVAQYLARVREASDIPVCAGFGIRSPQQVRALAPHADGLIVGSALVETLEAGKDPAAFIRHLKS